jgi:hypothetical protein
MSSESLNLKDLIKSEDLQAYQDILANGNLDNMQNNEPDNEEARRNYLRQKLRAKTKQLQSSRMSKDIREKSQIEMLKENPMFKNLNSVEGQQNPELMKETIEKIAASMCKDPRQKKNIKKQLGNIIEKMDK